jgi:hypothetical protein
MKLRKGSRVLITYKGREVEGTVRMVSDNQKSIALVFDGMLGGYIGMMPALDHGEGFRDLVEGDIVEVKPL